MSTTPEVVIGMPVYNDAAFLREALDSVLAQTFTDFRIVVSDDASTDGSDEICREYAARDPRITFVRQPRNLGISRNMEFLRDHAVAPWFAWVGDDDVWDPAFLERLLASVRGRPSAAVAFCTYALIDDEGRPIGSPRDFDYGGPTPLARLARLVREPDDCFGYGLVRGALAQRVCFPRWPWPSRDQAYNNIYPSLCHYLAAGDYVHVRGEPLYRKRVKSTEGLRHDPRSGGGLRSLARYTARRFYLVGYSARSVQRGGGPLLALRVLPALFRRWFLGSVFAEWRNALRSRARRSGRAPAA